jgi:CDP-glucose 4,6-dehydratase
MRLPDPSFWAGKRVFLTGHTGFKGSWCTLWLAALGAQVRGYALDPDTSPAMFNALALHEMCDHQIADLRDAAKLSAAVAEFRPDIVLHFAAQSLVLQSYAQPVETFEINVQGTINLLQACRNSDARAIVVVTSDKCYANSGSPEPFGEDDALGGDDPYSASKACAELVVNAWRRSFFQGKNCATIASARAGNIFGGGDWGENRLIPDAARAFSAAEPLVIRNPHAVRPWQIVTSPLSGYLLLAQAIWRDGAFGGAFNFGPAAQDAVTVRELVQLFGRTWGGKTRIVERPDSAAPHEAMHLTLSSKRAQDRLGWYPFGNLVAGLQLTADWYKAFYQGAAVRELRRLCLAALPSNGRNSPSVGWSTCNAAT